jgi:hypothetical protein
MTRREWLIAGVLSAGFAALIGFAIAHDIEEAERHRAMGHVEHCANTTAFGVGTNGALVTTYGVTCEWLTADGRIAMGAP